MPSFKKLEMSCYDFKGKSEFEHNWIEHSHLGTSNHEKRQHSISNYKRPLNLSRTA